MDHNHINLPTRVLLALSIMLLFVYTLPHVMALRLFLLVTAFLISVSAFLTALRQQQNELISALTIYSILQAWMLVVALFIADQSYQSLLEWKGQWLSTTLSFVIGIGLAVMLMGAQQRKPSSVIALVVAIPITLLIAVNSAAVLYDILLHESFITHDPGITDHTANIGYAIALLEPLLVADMLSRIGKRTPLLPVSIWVASIVLGMSVFALVTASSRNGLLTMLLAFILGGIMMLSELRKIYSRKRLVAVFAIGTFLISAYVGVALKSDPRWQTFIGTVPIAWDIDRDTRWLDGTGNDLPLLPNGESVEISAYYRIAWAHEAWRMLLVHPWGTEISRETFHSLELAKYGHAGMAHSHNGWLDFGLNFGFPGLLLWATFFSLLARTGWRAWKEYKEPLGFALVLLVVMFAFRALFDSIFRNHMIEQFMLVAGLLIGALTFNKKPSMSAQTTATNRSGSTNIGGLISEGQPELTHAEHESEKLLSDSQHVKY